MKILITGGTGQLAQEFQEYIKINFPDFVVLAPSHKDLDVTSSTQVEKIVNDFRPDLIINTAAYHKVDECETNIERTFAVNALGAYIVAKNASDIGAKSIYISTGFVFDGAKEMPYEESDETRPINIYGHSKALGEKLVSICDPLAYIVRTNALFGRFSGKNTKGGAGNFIDFVWSKAKAGEDLDMVSDQRIAPTFTKDLVRACISLVQDKVSGGIYHLTNSGETSWFEIAKKVYEIAGAQGAVKPITSEQRNAPAKRPQNALLASTKRPALPHWEDALRQYIEVALGF